MNEVDAVEEHGTMHLASSPTSDIDEIAKNLQHDSQANFPHEILAARERFQNQSLNPTLGVTHKTAMSLKHHCDANLKHTTNETNEINVGIDWT